MLALIVLLVDVFGGSFGVVSFRGSTGSTASGHGLVGDYRGGGVAGGRVGNGLKAAAIYSIQYSVYYLYLTNWLNVY